MKPIKKLLILILTILGIVMLYLGIANSLPPPAVTGIGFFVIAVLFLVDSK